MKREILTAAFTLLTTTFVFAQEIKMGDVTKVNESIVFNKTVKCTSYSMPIGGTGADIVYGEYKLGAVQGNRIHLLGELDGEIVSVDGNLETGVIRLSIQEKADVKTGAEPQYYFSTSGSFSETLPVVSLTATLNGRSKAIDCSKMK